MQYAKTLLVSLMLVGLIGCTVIPNTPAPAVASWDGDEQNSGVLGILPDHSAVITQRAEQRYIALAYEYGSRFSPPVRGNEAAPYTNSATVYTLRLDAEHLADWGIMANWKRKGVK